MCASVGELQLDRNYSRVRLRGRASARPILFTCSPPAEGGSRVLDPYALCPHVGHPGALFLARARNRGKKHARGTTTRLDRASLASPLDPPTLRPAIAYELLLTREVPHTAPRQIIGVSCIARMRASPPKSVWGPGRSVLSNERHYLYAPAAFC